MTNNSAIVAPTSAPAPAHKSSVKRGFHPFRYLKKVRESISALLPNVKQKAGHNIKQTAVPTTALVPKKGTDVIKHTTLVVQTTTLSTQTSIDSSSTQRNSSDAPLVGPKHKWLLEKARFPTREAWSSGVGDKVSRRGSEEYAVPDDHGQVVGNRPSAFSLDSVGANSDASQRPSLASISTVSQLDSTPDLGDQDSIYDNISFGIEQMEEPEFKPIPNNMLNAYSSMKNMVSRAIFESRSKEQLRVAKDSNYTDMIRIAAFEKAIEAAEHGAALGSVHAANDLLVMHREGVLQREGEYGKYLIDVNRSKSMFWFNVTNKLGKDVDKSNVLQNIEYHPSATNKLTDPVTKMVRFIEISRAIHDPGAAYYKEQYVDTWFQGFAILEKPTQGLHLSERPDMPSFVWTALQDYKNLQANRYA